MGRDIATIAEYDPFIDKHVFGFQLDVDGDVGTYVFEPLHQPHAYTATQQLPTQGNLVVASQREYEKLQHYEKYSYNATSITTIYQVWACASSPARSSLR